MCRLLGVSRSGYYAAKVRPESARSKRHRQLVSKIKRVHTQSRGVYGSPRIKAELAKVVGWSMSRNMTRRTVLDALKMAVAAREPTAGLVHHSDRGAQNTSEDFRDELEKHNIGCSMRSTGSCFDNAVAESFFALLKRERTNRTRYKTCDEARADIFDYIEVFYNRKRRHGYNGNVSSTDFEKVSGGSL